MKLHKVHSEPNTSELMYLVLEKLCALTETVNELKEEKKELEEKINVIYNFFAEEKEPVTKKRLTKKEQLALDVENKNKEIKKLSMQRLQSKTKALSS
ncbi:MAG TPA: hypothetical protein VF677_12485 [Flavobacterium sp.]